MSSREGRGHRRARRVGARIAARAALRLGAAVLGAVVVVGLLEAAALWARWAPAGVLAAGAVLAVPLTFLLGGRLLVRRYAEALRDLEVDDLTGARSRRAFGADLPDAVAAASAGARPLTLALVELTGIGGAVDVLGRRHTEALVRGAAASLEAGDAGDADGPATYRLAGEVFAVVLGGVGPDAAFDVADALLTGLARSAAPLSAVAGLCTLDARCPDAELLLIGASAALDEARSLGPGRVVASADQHSGLRWLATPGTRPAR